FHDAPDLHTAAHEAAHIVQQRAGVHLKGGVGQSGDAYERHADEVADLVVQGKPADRALDKMAGGGGGGRGAGLQLKGEDDKGPDQRGGGETSHDEKGEPSGPGGEDKNAEIEKDVLSFFAGLEGWGCNRDESLKSMGYGDLDHQRPILELQDKLTSMLMH